MGMMNWFIWMVMALLSFYPTVSEAAVTDFPNSMPKELKCGACWIMARQYAKKMKETGSIQDTIQTGHRMDKHNKVPRKKFKESELRVIEVTEQLCSKDSFHGYVIGEYNSTKYFTRNRDEIAHTRDSEGLFAYQRDAKDMLFVYCTTVLEEHEEEVETLVRSDSSAKGFRKRICRELTSACATKEDPVPKRPPPPPPAPASENSTSDNGTTDANNQSTESASSIEPSLVKVPVSTPETSQPVKEEKTAADEL